MKRRVVEVGIMGNLVGERQHGIKHVEPAIEMMVVGEAGYAQCVCVSLL
jgi:hypothetical protein